MNSRSSAGRNRLFTTSYRLSSSNSSSDNSTRAASTFSSRCDTFDVPGIGQHRPATGATATPARPARPGALALRDALDRGLIARGGQPAADNHGMKTIPLALAEIDDRFRLAVDEGCSGSARRRTGNIRRARAISSRPTSDSPMWRNLPAAGTAECAELILLRHGGSMRWSWYRRPVEMQGDAGCPPAPRAAVQGGRSYAIRPARIDSNQPWSPHEVAGIG